MKTLKNNKQNLFKESANKERKTTPANIKTVHKFHNLPYKYNFIVYIFAFNFYFAHLFYFLVYAFHIINTINRYYIVCGSFPLTSFRSR